MKFEDLQQAWQQQAQDELPLDKSLPARVKRTSRAFSRQIFWRDLREVAACIVVSLIFGKVALDAGAEGATATWPAWMAAALPIAVAAFFIVDRLIMHHRATPKGEALAVEIERTAKAVRHQIWLLRHVLWWYILPLALCSFLIGAQIILYAPESFPTWARWAVGALILLPTGWVDWWVWKLNQNAIQKDLQPRLAELESLQNELNAPAEQLNNIQSTTIDKS